MAPFRWFSVSHQVLPLHTMCAGEVILSKEVDKCDGKMIVAHYPPSQKGCFGCCALDTFVSFTFMVVAISRNGTKV